MSMGQTRISKGFYLVGLSFLQVVSELALAVAIVTALLFSSAALMAQVTNNELVINEVLASNGGAFVPNGSSETPDAIELKNLTNTDIDVSGFGIADDDSTLPWILPAGTLVPANGFLVIIADGQASELQTDFRLSAGGELVHLRDASGDTVDRLEFPSQRADISYGRLQDGSIAFFSTPSIGAENDEASSFVSFVRRPSVSEESGVYSGSLSVTLEANPGTEIRYTLDGTNPTTSSPLYTGALSISAPPLSTDLNAEMVRGVALKAVAIEGDNVSETASRTFLFDVVHDLPIIMLTADNVVDTGEFPITRLTDDQYYGWYDISGRVRFDFLETDGSLAVSQYTEYERSGNNSASLPPLNGKLRARARFGKDSLDHAFFREKPREKNFERILLRNTSQDFASTRMRDALVSRFYSAGDIVNVDYEGYRPCVLYLNGEYLGHINLREDDDNEFVSQYFDISGSASRGRTVGRGAYFFGVKQGLSDLTNSNIIERVNDIQRLDEALLDDAVRESMSNVVDRTIPIWTPEDPTQPRRISLHDYDDAFNLFQQVFRANLSLPSSWSEISWTSSLDPAGEDIRFWEEQVQFIAAYQNLFGYAERLELIVDRVANELRGEMPDTIEYYRRRRARVNRPLLPNVREERDLSPESLTEWENSVQFLRDLPAARLTGSLEDMRVTHGLPDIVGVNISSTDRSMGEVRVHGFRVTEGRELGRYFSQFPIRLTAEPKPGHVFVRWEGDVSDRAAKITPSFRSDATVQAVFAPSGVTIAAAGRLAISEILYNPLGTAEDDEFLELFNLTDAPLDLSGVSFVEGIEYTFPAGTILGANAFLVLRPSDYRGRLSNDGEELVYLDANGVEVERFRYNDGAQWPQGADGLGHSLVRVAPEEARDPLSLESSLWRISASIGGNPGTTDQLSLSDTSNEGLLDYAFGSTGAGLRGELTGDTLQLSFRRVPNADDVVISLFESTDLTLNSWTQIPSEQFRSREIIGNGVETITIEPFTLTERRAFYRLQVQQRN